ncbi:FAD-dependent oxidoreductase [Roseomonas sp. 18066]|uniref:FAD-dependent oxidoreductase n=1 Tax=Roseomonas sp. 18066 TaxID=2681412 RepID=UPI001357CE83|nr:FAD-dependent oxidoreductase [Roseomonas sp. 18066]
MDILVVGAGVAGLSLALTLQRGGRQVTVIDPLPPAGGASFGNAGMISADTAIPIALPGMLPRVPRWLLDPDGPLVVRPRHLPRALPWLARWMAEGRAQAATRNADAMRALHKDSFGHWRALLGDADFADLIRQTGQAYLWEDRAPPPGKNFEDGLRARHGVETRLLDRGELEKLFPGIAPSVNRGLLLPGNGQTVNPGRLVRRLGEKLLEAGGAIRAERVMKLLPTTPGWRVLTNIDNHDAAVVVVAGGAWSKPLLAPLGYALPIEAERGYHALLPAPSVTLPMTVTLKSRGFGLTSMEMGLRAAGTVEFAGIEAAPDERRAAALVGQVRAVFPGITHATPKLWMGHRPGTPDSLPLLGPLPRHPGLFLCCGHGHFGLTGGPPSAAIVAALINGQQPAVDPAPYAPGRFS